MSRYPANIVIFTTQHFFALITDNAPRELSSKSWGKRTKKVLPFLALSTHSTHNFLAVKLVKFRVLTLLCLMGKSNDERIFTTHITLLFVHKLSWERIFVFLRVYSSNCYLIQSWLHANCERNHYSVYNFMQWKKNVAIVFLIYCQSSFFLLLFVQL